MKAIAIFLISVYRWTISPLIGPCCRFYPSCSEYALKALKVHKTPTALWLIVKRLVRCSSLSKGGFDPVPEKDQSLRDWKEIT